MKIWFVGVLLAISWNAPAQTAGRNLPHDRISVYSWVDAEGNRHFTDDRRKAPSSAVKRTVYTPRPTPVYVSSGSSNGALSLPPIPPPVNTAPPPTSLPPSSLPPLPTGGL